MLIRAAAANVEPGGLLDESALNAMGPDHSSIAEAAQLPRPARRDRAAEPERALAMNDGNVTRRRARARDITPGVLQGDAPRRGSQGRATST